MTKRPGISLVEYGEATGLSIAPKRRAFKLARVPLSWKSNHDDDNFLVGSRATALLERDDDHDDKNVLCR